MYGDLVKIRFDFCSVQLCVVMKSSSRAFISYRIDFPRVAAHTDASVVVRIKFISVLKIGVIKPWITRCRGSNLHAGITLKYVLERLIGACCLCCFIISVNIPSGPDAFWSWRFLIFSLSSLSVMGKSNGFWSSLIVNSSFF